MSLQPDNARDLDRNTTSPFLLRLYWRRSRTFESYEFSVAPPSPADPTDSIDYSSLLPSSIRSQSVQIYTWPTCTLSELTSLLMSVLPTDTLPSPAVGTRLVYKLIFPDTRAEVRDGGRGKWMEKPLGSVVIGAGRGDGDDEMDVEGDEFGRGRLEGDAAKTLSDARFVIGDYVVCSIFPPGPDGRTPAGPSPSSRGPPMSSYRERDAYGGRNGLPPSRDNGYGPPRGGYRGGYGGRGGGGFGTAPPSGEWRRGERPPGGPGGGRGGYGSYGYGRGGRDAY